MKNNKGISLISMVITIIVIIILAAITIFYGLFKTTDTARETKSVYEVYSLIDAVVNRTLMNRLNDGYYKFVGDTKFGKETINGIDYYSGDGWYLISTKENFRDLGVDNVSGKYLVNYEKGLVISTVPIEYKGEAYYSLNELQRDMGGGVTVLSRVEYDENKKVNKPVLSEGMIPVKLSGGSWVVASVDDDGWYDYSANQMAWANVMLKDELKVEDDLGRTYSNEEIRNMSISDLEGMKIVNEGSSYVWIPRYTTKSLGETGSEIIFSNLTNDTTSYNGNTYILPDSFTYIDEMENRIELPGIWISKYEASFNKQ